MLEAAQPISSLSVIRVVVANLWSFFFESIGTRGLEELLNIDLKMLLPSSAQMLTGRPQLCSLLLSWVEGVLIGTDSAG